MCPGGSGTSERLQRWRLKEESDREIGEHKESEPAGHDGRCCDDPGWHHYSRARHLRNGNPAGWRWQEQQRRRIDLCMAKPSMGIDGRRLDRPSGFVGFDGRRLWRPCSGASHPRSGGLASWRWRQQRRSGSSDRCMAEPSVGIDGRRLVWPNRFVGFDGRRLVQQCQPPAHRAPRTHLAHRLEGSRAMAPGRTESAIRPRTVDRYLLVPGTNATSATNLSRTHSFS